MRLRQACCHPGLLPFPEAADVEESAKFDLLVETLDKTVPAGHRTLIFSQWTALLKRVIPRLEENGWDYLYLDGRTTKRHELVKKWNEPSGPPVFLISLRAGGTGLNLTGADHVPIHGEPPEDKQLTVPIASARVAGCRVSIRSAKYRRRKYWRSKNVARFVRHDRPKRAFPRRAADPC